MSRYVFISRDSGSFDHDAVYVNESSSKRFAQQERRALAILGCPVGPIVKVPVPAKPKKRRSKA
jgi:hypothetical protein